MKDNKNDAKPEVEKVDQVEEKLSDDDLEAITGGTIIRPHSTVTVLKGE